ncbi:hypothetical protein RclHR1_04740009 [Rhizophagus clarus]|uniref:F-box domain-containing protein n=1 Tax=Rhizophagus clarus TaxID=94130 RepID=A0A2Z6RJ40_9GLOM|nr:hypothetical protein RclHR1_04740009 [Rhizophagus clarus]GES79299.1 hypothetical protein GLOIN_2v1784879 [Rhizophagus clarus]
MACSKIFSGDLPELTSEIIQYFRNDFSTLHSCVLVNRLWCHLSIALLWEDPFSKNCLKNYHFIEICLFKLNDDDKVKLKEYGILIDLFPSKTLFNYPSFIQNLNVYNICHSIENWIHNNVKTTTNEKQLSNFIFLSLIKIFIKNIINLHTFEVEASNILMVISRDCFISAFELISQNPNFICNVKNLNICFDGLTNDLLSFLKYLYSNCNSISSLYIHYSDDLDNYTEKVLSKVINSQHNLRKIYFGQSSYHFLRNLKIPNCSNTLKTIIFHNVYLKNLEINFNEVFNSLNVLESIHIIYCHFFDSTIIQQIISLTKPFKLKSLFMDSELQIEQLKLLLQLSGDYLENIGFSSMNNELKLQSIKLVKIYCIKIKFIDLIRFDDQNVFSAFDLIKNFQQNLNYLNINFCQFGREQLSYDDKLSSIVLQNLGQILPYKLEYLGLALKINVNDLKTFFENSHCIFIRKLLIRNKVYQESDDILSCIKKYIMKEKRVTYLAIENLHYCTNERKNLFHLEDIEEFKFYGIQFINYDNLCIEIHDFINELY